MSAVAGQRAGPRSIVRASMPPVAPGQRVGLVGGSFNPPHAGHLSVAATALRRLSLDRVWWLVSPGNPLKSHRDLAPIDERLAAVRALARDRRMAATGLEAALGTRYTVDTLAAVRRRQPQVRFVWIMGADAFAGLHRWRDWRRIATLAPIAVVDRPGWRLKALASPAARTLARSRIDERRAASLPLRRPPAWTFLSMRHSPLSSTALRHHMKP